MEGGWSLTPQLFHPTARRFIIKVCAVIATPRSRIAAAAATIFVRSPWTLCWSAVDQEGTTRAVRSGVEGNACDYFRSLALRADLHFRGWPVLSWCTLMFALRASRDGRSSWMGKSGK